MATIEEVDKRVKVIEDRNKEVESNKGWETSFTRRFLLIAFTYLAIAIYLQFINIERAFLHAIVPALAFMLSTLTLPWFKKKWMNNK
tara:strand:+ start:413 stop:673 length:261 start_codon:yes stop_codon:yes gene_type:complete